MKINRIYYDTKTGKRFGDRKRKRIHERVTHTRASMHKRPSQGSGK